MVVLPSDGVLVEYAHLSELVEVLDRGKGLGKERVHELVGALEARVGRHNVVDFVVGVGGCSVHRPQQIEQPIGSVAAVRHATLERVVVSLVGHEILTQKQNWVDKQPLVGEIVNIEHASHAPVTVAAGLNGLKLKVPDGNL